MALYICLCHGITDKQIRSCVVESGARTLCDLSGKLGVATQCGSCAHSACEVLSEALESAVIAAAPAAESSASSSAFAA
jgi:bacterioferritin-associated ferredoxin